MNKSMILLFLFAFFTKCLEAGEISNSCRNITFLGTFRFDFDSLRQGGDDFNNEDDMWIEHVDDSASFITPRNGAKLSIQAPIETPLSSNRISINDINTGYKLLVKTNSGKSGTLTINKLYDSHDNSIFDTQSSLFLKNQKTTEVREWMEYLRGENIHKKYHFDGLWCELNGSNT